MAAISTSSRTASSTTIGVAAVTPSGDDRDQADKRADHENVAVGEIDHADDAIDHRVADRDQPVDRAERQAVDQLLQKICHAVPISRGHPADDQQAPCGRLNRAKRERQRRAAPLLIELECALKAWASNGAQVGQMRDATVARPCDQGRIAAPIMRLVKATKKPDQHQNRNRHPNQPQKHIASHRRFSLLQRRELDAHAQVPDTLLQCVLGTIAPAVD